MRAASVLVNGTSLYFEDSETNGPPIVFSHGLLWNASLFAPQIAELRNRFRCVAYDHRGQGRSGDVSGRAIDLDTLTADAEALIESLNLGPVHFSGLSMGGFVGMRLALRRPDLVRSLILIGTSADSETSWNRLNYRALAFLARGFGMGCVAGPVMTKMLGDTVLGDPARKQERMEWRNSLLSNRKTIWRAVNGVIERGGICERLHEISMPTLVIAGNEDKVFDASVAKRLAEGIRDAKLVMIHEAGHSCTLEQPGAVTQAIKKFLKA